MFSRPGTFLRLFPFGCLAPAVGIRAQELLKLTGGGRRDERRDAPPTSCRSHFSIMKMPRKFRGLEDFGIGTRVSFP